MIPLRKLQFGVLEIESDMNRLRQKFETFLVEKSPSVIWNEGFIKFLGVHQILVNVNTERSLVRGLATSDGEVRLTLNKSSRWMEDSQVYTLNGLDDMSPVGIYVHELGHHFQWALERQGVDDIFDTYFCDLPRTSAVSPYARTSPTEDFAETFRVFVTNPDLLRSHCKVRYNAMRRLDAAMKLLCGFSLLEERDVEIPNEKRFDLYYKLIYGE